jgi:ABC-2 type transport system permease protein
MKSIFVTFTAECLKIRKSKVFWLSIIFFVFVSFMMGLLMFVQIHPEISGKLGMVGTKASMLRLGEPNWKNYFSLLTQGIAAIGLVGYGFVTSWVFGREYSDKTVKDILALPVSRSYIVLSKFIVITLWSVLLTLIFFISAILVGKIAGISGWSDQIISEFARTFTIVSCLSILLCTPVAFFASFSRGYLLPFAFIILTLLLANFTGFVGLGPYFPWAIPGILSVPPTEDLHLNTASYIILLLTSILGYIGTLAWWRFADQK